MKETTTDLPGYIAGFNLHAEFSPENLGLGVCDLRNTSLFRLYLRNPPTSEWTATEVFHGSRQIFHVHIESIVTLLSCFLESHINCLVRLKSMSKKESNGKTAIVQFKIIPSVSNNKRGSHDHPEIWLQALQPSAILRKPSPAEDVDVKRNPSCMPVDYRVLKSG